MKTANVILGIFLWLCIPASMVLGLMFGISYAIGSGGSSEGMVCCIVLPAILFILGLAVMLMGRDKTETRIDSKKKSDRYCPNCGRGIPFDARTCPYCSKKFNDLE